MDKLHLDLADLDVVSFTVDSGTESSLMALGMGHGTTEVGASCYCFPPYCCCASCCSAADEIAQDELPALGPDPAE